MAEVLARYHVKFKLLKKIHVSSYCVIWVQFPRELHNKEVEHAEIGWRTFKLPVTSYIHFGLNHVTSLLWDKKNIPYYLKLNCRKKFWAGQISFGQTRVYNLVLLDILTYKWFSPFFIPIFYLTSSFIVCMCIYWYCPDSHRNCKD